MYRLPYAAPLPRMVYGRTHVVLAVFLAALAWLGCLAWMRPLALPDEGRYVGVSLEMLHSDNWITPTLDGLPFLHKPPLFYWITAGAMHLFGLNEWAARAAPVLGGATTVAVLFAALREWAGESAARMAALVLATLPLFYGGSQFANMDQLVAACISAAILFGARASFRFEAGTERSDDLASAYVAAALGVLAKGLIGLVLPGLVLLLWLGTMRHWRTMRALVWWPGTAMLAVIVVPWLVAVQWENPGFLYYYFVVQQFQRYAGSGFNNVQAVWFYIPVLAVFGLPWTGWLLANLRRSVVTRACPPAVRYLMWLWLGVVVLFFSIPQSKPMGYALPALAPLAALIALTAAPLVKDSHRARIVWQLCAGTAAVVCVVVTIGFAVARPKTSLDLAMALAASRDPHDGLAFIDEYRYDVSFYLRDAAPVFVVSNWDPVEVRQNDNWRRELADAASFAPVVDATRLLGSAQFRKALCSGRIKWVMAKLDSATRYPMLNTAQLVATDRDSALWRTDVANPIFATAANCAAAPAYINDVR